jgi:transposase
LATEWGEEVAYQAVRRLVHRRLKAKLKRPRPTHPKKR